MGMWIDGEKLDDCPACGKHLEQSEYDFQHCKTCDGSRADNRSPDECAAIWHAAHEIAKREIDRIRNGRWGGGHEPHPGLAASIANFAVEIAGREREACAKIADDACDDLDDESQEFFVAANIMAAIRARSNQSK